MSDIQPKVPPGEPQEEWVPEDDAVIGVAFRRSLVVIAVLALVVAGVLWLRGGERQQDDVVAQGQTQAPQVVQTPVATPKVSLVDVTAQSGIRFNHQSGAYGERLLPETMGGGVAFLDVDADGDQDVVLASGNRWPWRTADPAMEQTVALYINDGTGQFIRADEDWGLKTQAYIMGISTADYDADGHMDLFFTGVGTNLLFRNHQGLGFQDVSAPAGVSGSADSWSTGAAFFDADGDEDLDLVVANYVTWSPEIDREVGYQMVGVGRAYGPPTNFPGSQLTLYRNDGQGRFEDVTDASGLQVFNPATEAAVAKALAVVPVDLNGDRLPDLVVANDTTRNFAFINLGEGRFEEQGQALGIAFDNAGKSTGAMGTDWAWPTDGDELVIAIGNFANEMTSWFATQPGFGVFSDDAIVAGVGPGSRQALTFGLFFFDVDLDGRVDLLQNNGHVENEINRVQPSQHYRQPGQLFWNCGEACPRQFVPLDAEAIGDLARPRVGRGAAYGDIDGDGDLDVLLGQVDGPFELLRNDTPAGHWLRIRLSQSGGNRDALGARVEVQADGHRQLKSVQTVRSYLSSVELPLTFGLGSAVEAEVRVTWPDGTLEAFGVLSANQSVRLIRGEGVAPMVESAAEELRP